MEITKSSSESNERIHLIKDGEILLTIAPWFGAKLTKLKLPLGGRHFDVLWPVSDNDLEVNTWYKQSILFPYPNRLKDGKYSFEGKDYQFPINEPDKNNQLHGMLYNVPFQVSRSEVRGEIATISLVHRYNGTFEYYPFPFTFEITYTYDASGLDVAFDVSNEGSHNMPFGIGWHPYFQLGNSPLSENEFTAGPAKALQLDKQRSLPTGVTTDEELLNFDLANVALDNAFFLKDKKPSYSLQRKGGPKLSFECSEGFSYLQVFTPEAEDSIAVEPMTCHVNAFNNKEGIRTLAPNEKFDVSVKLKML
jgi:aldose 1-epimerase